MKQSKILILEHDPTDVELLERALKGDLNYICQVAENRKEFEKALVEFKPDLILSDYCLPAFDGLTAFAITQEISPGIPFIVVSGAIGDENAVGLIRMGITDYVLKENLHQVIPKVRRALKEAQDRQRKLIAEQKLRQSQQEIQKIMDSSADLICSLDEEGKFLKVSAASLKILGYRPEELLGRQAIELVYVEDQERTRKALKVFRSGGGDIAHFENRYLHKSGRLVPMFWTSKWDDLEKISYSVARDASAIKKAEQELAEQAELTRNILDSITDGFFSVDENWIVRYWNREAENFLLRKREEVLNKNLWDIFGDAVDLKSYEVYHRVMAEKIPVSFEDYYPTLDRWYGINAYPSKSGISVFFKDITQNFKNKAALEQSEKRFKALVQEGSDLICILDEDRRYQYVSPTFTSVLGLESSELIGLRPLEYVHEDDRKGVNETTERLRTEKQLNYKPFRYKDRHGQYRWFETTGTNLLEDPSVQGLVLNSRDITENIIHLQDIESRNNILQEIAWIQSHLVRSPLSRIMGLIAILKDHPGAMDTSEILGHIQTSAEELDDVIRTIVTRTEQVSASVMKGD